MPMWHNCTTAVPHKPQSLCATFIRSSPVPGRTGQTDCPGNGPGRTLSTTVPGDGRQERSTVTDTAYKIPKSTPSLTHPKWFHDGASHLNLQNKNIFSLNFMKLILMCIG